MRMAARMEKAQFDFTDFLGQMKMLKRLGPLSGVLGMLPGMGKMKDAIGGMDAEKRMKHMEALVLSMTPETDTLAHRHTHTHIHTKP
jgi:signal recognition particle subunit SRP54